jgi:hypothetical protein
MLGLDCQIQAALAFFAGFGNPARANRHIEDLHQQVSPNAIARDGKPSGCLIVAEKKALEHKTPGLFE